jgi:hypothetical protein
MGSSRRLTPVKLFVGVPSSDGKLITPAKDRLVASNGAIDHESALAPGLDRIFMSFERLIEADQFADVRSQTSEIAEEMGYLENAKVVMVSTNDFRPRVYHFKHDTFQFDCETRPNLNNYQPFFLQVRRIYRAQLRTMCILNREEKP